MQYVYSIWSLTGSQNNFNTITQHEYEKVLLEKGSLEYFIL